MRHPERSFQKAFGFSVAVHIAVFGSALAFAHYGGPFFDAGFRSIQVALVGPAGTGGTGSGPVRRASMVKAPAAVTASVDPAAAAPPSAPQRDAAPAGMTDVPAAAGTDGSSASGNGATKAADGAAAGGFAQDSWAELSAALERAKTYPRIARERGIEGTVVVRFHVLPTGAVNSITVVRSSGAKVLDDASVRTVQRAAPVTAGQGWVEVPMVYELRD